jgi:hypothetical protein
LNTREGAKVFCYTLSNGTKSKVVTVQTIKGMGERAHPKRGSWAAAPPKPKLKKKKGFLNMMI